MSVKIFATPEPVEKSVDDIVGRFRTGQQLNGRPVALKKFRITTGDPDVADVLADLYGGSPSPWETTTEEKLEVFTDISSLDVVIEPGGLRTGMVLWGRKGKIRSCDGVTQQDGSACVCPSALADRKAAAQNGTGCEPSLQAYFRLVDAPTLGKFKYFSSAWSAIRDVPKVEDALDELGRPAVVNFSIEEVTMKDGKTFVKPVFKLIGPYEAA